MFGKPEVVVRHEIDADREAHLPQQARRLAARRAWLQGDLQIPAGGSCLKSEAQPVHQLLIVVDRRVRRRSAASRPRKSSSRPQRNTTPALRPTTRAALPTAARAPSARRAALTQSCARARSDRDRRHRPAACRRCARARSPAGSPGCGSRRPSCASIAQRSRDDSPMPMMPPQHTLRPASCTC